MAVRLDQLFETFRRPHQVLVLLTGLVASSLILACLASAASAADRVYWTNGGCDGNRIAFANLNGSGGGNLGTAGAAIRQPRGMAINMATGKVYWTNRGTTGFPSPTSTEAAAAVF